MTTFTSVAATLLAVALVTPPPAAPASPKSTPSLGPTPASRTLLAEAQRSYLAVEPARARELARRARQAGGLRREELAQAYALEGDCAAILGDYESAYAAYRRLLLLHREAIVNPDLNPAMRAPFERAQSFWKENETTRTLDLELTTAAEARVFRLQLHDRLNLANLVRLWTRSHKDEDFQPFDYEANAFPVQFPMGNGTQLEYRWVLYDAYGNELAEAGNDGAPLRIILPPAPPPPPKVTPESKPLLAPTAPAQQETKRPLHKSPWLWIGVSLAAAGLVTGLAVGLTRQPNYELRPMVRF